MLPEALRFQVGLIDQISKPLGNIQRNLNDVTNTYRQGTHTMMAGAAGMVGSGFALQQALMPAIEMDRKLGEVKSLGVADEQLQTLTSTAMKFSVEYGKSATEFVDSSYKIQSAISTLKGNELSELTHISGVLAAATKADTETITGYMGQMHKIFNDDAVEMGNVAWAQKLAGQTATVVRMFNTEGREMAAAFQNFQSIGQKNKIAMEEQFAVLGTLQAITQSGSRAGTQYSSFLQGVAKAQDKFGNKVSFQNQDGSMKSVIDIMAQLKTLYGDTLDLSEQAELKEAFGGQQAVNFIMNMMNETDGLNKSIKELQDVSGLKEARDMAHTMTDQWERLEQGVFAVRSAFGAALLPALLPVVGVMADGAMEIIEWTRLFPNITKWIGLAGIALLTFVAVNGAVTMAVGISKQAFASYLLVTKLLGAAQLAWSKIMTFCKANLFALSMNMQMYGVRTKLVTAWQWLQNTAMTAAAVAYGAVSTAVLWVGNAFMKATMAAMRFFVVLMANPIVLIFTAVVAAIGAVIYYWDELKSAFGDTAWFAPIEAVFNYFSELLSGLQDSFKDFVSWIPGLGGDDSLEVKSKSVQSATPRAQIQPGGAAKNIASYQTSSTNYGGVAIYPTYMNSPQDMASEIEMAAG
ncbi:phage tail tape measure protein [Vibrio parahaemolyticus]|uniref:phage tail tape measure protein n=1 Tax=Vibrio parahaemolyticus TaxID=670 RepID=UPI002269E1DD|nr:phage tail tape measure protein [Vibrio parahaemolyticus]MCX8827917.1 phage tail tape measure protein [Vibrio parahaemolyticus]MCX8928667.1 phage tail tape measure protein [Vibrio parahaemolyticus]